MIVSDAAASSQSRHQQTQPVRLGVIDYLNVVPVYDWLLRREQTAGGLPGIATVAGTPAQMNRALLAGDIDISNVSSFAFGAQARDWLLLPRLSVAAHGRVDSVLLFSWRKDWRELDGGSIALTDHSATSIELVRLLCERRYGIQPRYVTQSPDLDAMLAAHDAALLIGDSALTEGIARREIAGRGRPYVFDLAAEWQAWTELPFCFSVWAARADRADAVRASGAVELLHASKERGLADLDRLAVEAAARLKLSRRVCAAYLRLLDYELTDRDVAGLRLFLEMAVPGFGWEDVRFV
ncbi:MAG TPA: menaquinone biosynthesis protein [Ktedonobacterales bacterium]|nr:menaquinone biosynthesis protein [Ktedonobacterales bacterium]